MNPKILLDIASCIKAGLDYLDENKSKTYDAIAYSEIVERMLKSRPADSSVKSCAILKELKENGSMLLYIVYLDEKSQPVWGPAGKSYGFQMTTKKIDAELTEYFGDSDLIIFN